MQIKLNFSRFIRILRYQNVFFMIYEAGVYKRDVEINGIKKKKKISEISHWYRKFFKWQILWYKFEIDFLYLYLLKYLIRVLNTIVTHAQ